MLYISCLQVIQQLLFIDNQISLILPHSNSAQIVKLVNNLYLGLFLSQNYHKTWITVKQAFVIQFHDTF